MVVVITFEHDLWLGRVCQADQQDDIAIERRILLRKCHGRGVGAKFDSHRVRGGLNPALVCCRRHDRLKRQVITVIFQLSHYLSDSALEETGVM